MTRAGDEKQLVGRIEKLYLCVQRACRRDRKEKTNNGRACDAPWRHTRFLFLIFFFRRFVRRQLESSEERRGVGMNIKSVTNMRRDDSCCASICRACRAPGGLPGPRFGTNPMMGSSSDDSTSCSFCLTIFFFVFCRASLLRTIFF